MTPSGPCGIVRWWKGPVIKQSNEWCFLSSFVLIGILNNHYIFILLGVYISKYAKNNLNPVWSDAVIDVTTLCNGDLSQTIMIYVYNHKSNGKHGFMGDLETTLTGFITVKVRNVLTLKKKGKSKGHIQVTSAVVTGVDSLTSQMSAVSILGDNISTYHSTINVTPTNSSITQLTT